MNTFQPMAICLARNNFKDKQHKSLDHEKCVTGWRVTGEISIIIQDRQVLKKIKRQEEKNIVYSWKRY